MILLGNYIINLVFMLIIRLKKPTGLAKHVLNSSIVTE